MITAALFDFDGTLANTDAAHLACWNRCLEKYGARIDVDFYIEHCVGNLTLHITRCMQEEFPSCGISAEILAQEKDDAYAQWIAVETIPLMPGVKEILAFLAEQQVACGLVTGAPLSGIQKTLQDHRLTGFFQTIITRETVKKGKPAPDGYQFALQTLGMDAAHAAAFEDTRTGVLAAQAAGIKCFAIPSPFTRTQDFSAADIICTDLLEARRILAKTIL
jgi:HAD superfamily hydrolase (TIGR01509 family)